MVEDAVYRLGLGLIRDVEVAVVVMADILLIQARKARRRAFRRFPFSHIPVRHQVQPVGVHAHRKQDDVIQDPQGLGVSPAGHLINQLHQLLRSQNFGRVQPAVYPDDGAPLAGQSAGLLIRKPLGLG